MRHVFFCALLACCAEDRIEARVERVRPRVERATTAAKTGPGEETLASVVAEFARAGDIEVVAALERECRDPERRSVYWSTLARVGATPEAVRLLETWAAREPDSIELAPFRPGGVEDLLAWLEDAARPPQARARCAWALAHAGDRSALPRLRALADDPTPVPIRSLRAGSGVPTLGDIVRDCIRMLEG